MINLLFTKIYDASLLHHSVANYPKKKNLLNEAVRGFYILGCPKTIRFPNLGRISDFAVRKVIGFLILLGNKCGCGVRTM